MPDPRRRQPGLDSRAGDQRHPRHGGRRPGRRVRRATGRALRHRGPGAVTAARRHPGDGRRVVLRAARAGRRHRPPRGRPAQRQARQVRRPRRRAELLERAHDAGMGTIVGSMMEGPIGVGAAAALVAAVGTTTSATSTPPGGRALAGRRRGDVRRGRDRAAGRTGLGDRGAAVTGVLRVGVPVATMWASRNAPRDLDAAALADRPDDATWLARAVARRPAGTPRPDPDPAARRRARHDRRRGRRLDGGGGAVAARTRPGRLPGLGPHCSPAPAGRRRPGPSFGPSTGRPHRRGGVRRAVPGLVYLWGGTARRASTARAWSTTPTARPASSSPATPPTRRSP